MADVTKVSDITVGDITDYIRLSEPTTEDTLFLTTALSIAKNYVMSYTGLDAQGMDEHVDLVIVIYVLCQDMFDTRALYVDKTNINKVVDSILGLHIQNFLPSE